MRSSSVHLFMAILLCIFVAGGYAFWYTMVEAESAAVASLENQIITKTQTASRIASARATLAEIADSEAAVRSYFVPETGVVSFINSLEALGSALGTVVGVLSVSTNPDVVRPMLSLSITVKGTFDGVMRTVGAIEYAPYDLSIPNLSVTQDAEGSWRADLGLLVGSVAASATTTTP